MSDVLNYTWGFSKAGMSFSLRGDLFLWAICLGIRQDYLRPFLLALSLLQNTDRSIESLADLSWFGEAPRSRVDGWWAFHQDTRVRLHLLLFWFSPDSSLSWGHLPVPFRTSGAVSGDGLSNSSFFQLTADACDLYKPLMGLNQSTQMWQPAAHTE